MAVIALGNGIGIFRLGCSQMPSLSSVHMQAMGLRFQIVIGNITSTVNTYPESWPDDQTQVSICL